MLFDSALGWNELLFNAGFIRLFSKAACILQVGLVSMLTVTSVTFYSIHICIPIINNINVTIFSLVLPITKSLMFTVFSRHAIEMLSVSIFDDASLLSAGLYCTDISAL